MFGGTYPKGAVSLLSPPSLHLLEGFCQSFWTALVQLYLPDSLCTPWFQVHASGLLFFGQYHTKNVAYLGLYAWERLKKKRSQNSVVRLRN